MRVLILTPCRTSYAACALAALILATSEAAHLIDLRQPALPIAGSIPRLRGQVQWPI